MLACLLLLAALAWSVPVPAYAGTFGGYETKVTGVTPSVAGVRVRATLNGEGITVTNASDQPVIVEGYQGEDYLEVTSTGVRQNDLSPAVYLNKEQTIGSLPQDAAADKAPQWSVVSGDDHVQWHDHRIHWMGASEPPAVAADPGHRHLVSRWTIPIRVGTTTGAITGTLSYVPGSRWGAWLPYLAIGAGVVVVVAVQLLVVRRRRTS
ncbi:MAG: hypothetical protein QM572_15785 [Nocardioides sp.]|uniref:hypothetical protein n=1 Tax=Nocardioides sp. TaxID=35761 RepID=UPI0039E6856B